MSIESKGVIRNVGRPPIERSAKLRYGLVGILLLAIGVCLISACAHTGSKPTRTLIGFDVFFDDLAMHGDWLWLESYGWVWMPWETDAAWRPYTRGHWLYTTSGWTWVSSWTWGWAPFHYGRWLQLPVYGWVWIPDRHWAPAWVAWRYSAGTVGWAPLPLNARWIPGSGLQWDGATGIHPKSWSFVNERYLLSEDVGGYLIRGSETPRLLAETRDHTRYEVRSRGILARGLPVDALERGRGPIPRVPIFDLDRPPARYQQRVEPDGVSIYRPSVDSGRHRPAPEGQRKSGRGRR